MLPLRADWNASRHFPPLLKTRTATTGTSVLCDENGMASHWRLLPVVLRIGRRQPHANEILAMTAYCIQALFRYVLPVRSRKPKAAPKLRFAEPQKCRVKCSLARHGLRYIFFHHPLVFLNLHATARPPQPIKPLRTNYTILRRFAANPIHIQSPSTHAEWRSRGEVSRGPSPRRLVGVLSWSWRVRGQELGVRGQELELGVCPHRLEGSGLSVQGE